MFEKKQRKKKTMNKIIKFNICHREDIFWDLMKIEIKNSK